MNRSVKSRSHRKAKQPTGTNHREARPLDPIQMRRYLAFVRAIVGATAKANGR